jgi:hypothetical protein
LPQGPPSHERRSGRLLGRWSPPWPQRSRLSLRRLLRKRCDRSEFLDFNLGKREPRRKRVLLGGSGDGGGLGGDGLSSAD